MKVVIEIEVQDEYADPDDSSGLTEAGYVILTDGLRRVGDIVDIRKADDE